MSDIFYKNLRKFGRPLVFGATRTLILHPERVPRAGGCLLAANHHSYFDSMVLIGATERMIDWLSIVELFQNPVQRWWMRGMNCLALDRSGPDLATTRELVHRLRNGRMVGVFPEAELRPIDRSVLAGGPIHPGTARLAMASDVPILPVVVLGAGQFDRPSAWIPGAGTFLAINFGEPLVASGSGSEKETREHLENALARSFAGLFDEIKSHPGWAQGATGSWWKNNIPNK